MRNRQKFDEVSFAPLWRGFAGYHKELFRSDSIAALGVALLSLPLSMAYALAAGLPTSVGLFSAIFGTIIAASLGSSRHLVVGPTNTIAILIQAGITEILYSHYRDATGPERAVLAMNILIQITFVVGMLQMLSGVFRLGKLTQFVSRSVVLGYIAGTALATIINQIFFFLGVPLPARPDSLFGKAEYFVTHWWQIHIPTSIVGVGALLLFFLSARFSKRMPASVLVLAVASVAVLFLSPISEAIDGEAISSKVLLVKDFGEIHGEVPRVEPPFFDMRVMNTLLPIAFAIALLGILEATSIARSIAAQTGQVLSINQEIFALGVSNIFCSFLGAMTSSGSFNRSSLNYTSGAQTRLAAVLSGLFSAFILFLIHPLVMQIPLAALAALLIISATRLINWKELKVCIRATASDALVLVTTTLACVFLSLDIAFYIGVILSIVFYLRKASTPRFVECEMAHDGTLKALQGEGVSQRAVRIIQVEGELFFAAADLLQSTIKAIARDPAVKIIVLHLTNAYHIDATSCMTLQYLHRSLAATGRQLIASGLTRQAWRVLSDSGLVQEIGSDNLFLLNEQEPNVSTTRAVGWAYSLLASTD